ncbi:hypothetical protein JW835_10945 [bacterium]|nr:hypothetical protein [bacterium]
MRSKHNNDNRWRTWRWVTYFRLLIWWGAERMQNMQMRFSRQEIAKQRNSREQIFPKTEWVCDGHHAYCLVGSCKHWDYQIIELYDWSEN